MHKTIINAAVAAALLAGASGMALAEDSPFSANVGFVSDYQYRGWSQTNEKMALQGGFDYAHPSGFYAGVWGSNVSWIKDAYADADSSLEVDIYGGYTMNAGPIGLDFGLLQYYYPGSGVSDAAQPSFNTLEGYVGASWEFLTFKYSHSFTNLFGVPDSKGSGYYDLGASYEVGYGITVDAHIGRQHFTHSSGTSYNDWKVGVSKDFGGFDFGLQYVDTDVDNEKLADKRFIVSVSKSF
ncbi:porin [Nitrogeniibacter mangrovi]|uniref:Porin n=1 Tax=Nitrogeniibacter mangrovi TaxID=2016596 RepID=A0A6C1B990_9RHOO|nr:TorF family putative porin [Nitrogeniibacter mangrovi]QID19405.1 porin [Nitrogeniibacter mangrovi]